jgi:hypothetical protein
LRQERWQRKIKKENEKKGNWEEAEEGEGKKNEKVGEQEEKDKNTRRKGKKGRKNKCGRRGENLKAGRKGIRKGTRIIPLWGGRKVRMGYYSPLC